MLLVGPVQVARQILVPAAVALIGIGTQQPTWLLLLTPLIIIGACAIGFLPWFTTRYRITDTQLVVTRGLLNRTRLTAPLERIRSVDLEASLLHRVLGLQKVEVGTGVDDTRIELNSLSTESAEELRTFLLERGTDAAGPVQAEAAEPAAVPRADLARLDLRWARYAPLSLSRLAVVAGAIGALTQFTDDFPIVETGHALWDRVLSFSLALVVVVAVLGLALLWVLIAVAGYLIQWWDMRLFREAGNLRLTRGLFTTTSTTIEEARIRGSMLVEPLLLRAADGAELRTLVTGLEERVFPVLPACPRGFATGVGAELLGTSEPFEVTLLPHGAAARRRAHLRAQVPTLAAAAAGVVVTWAFGWSVWIAVVAVVLVAALGAVVGEATYRHLGHRLTSGYLVAGSGALTRVRTALERGGIIGWVVTQSFFQRRRGLATLVATTAAGSEHVTVLDVPVGTAVAVADAATPGMLTAFLRD